MNKKEVQELQKLGISPDKFEKECYYLDHNMENRTKAKHSDHDKEQAALDQILKKPMIKGSPSPIRGATTDGASPYGGIE